MTADRPAIRIRKRDSRIQAFCSQRTRDYSQWSNIGGRDVCEIRFVNKTFCIIHLCMYGRVCRIFMHHWCEQFIRGSYFDPFYYISKIKSGAGHAGSSPKDQTRVRGVVVQMIGLRKSLFTYWFTSVGDKWSE